MSMLKAWLLAARPKTLWAGVAPVIIGTAMAITDLTAHWPAAACALIGSLLIQIGTNFANDYFDYVKGVDTTDRIGPTRATQSGLVSAAAMKWATVVTFALVLLPGAYLVARGGWPLAVIGILSVLFGVLYTGGPRPLGYLGLGDVFVLFFFGPIAVGGTYYAQALAVTWPVVMAGFAPGLLSVAILTVNNLRDVEQDRAAGKRTVAVRFGTTFAKVEYIVAVLVATVAIPACLVLFSDERRPLALLSVVAVFAALPTARTVFTSSDGPALNEALAATGRVLLLFSLLFSGGWLVG